VDNLVSEDVVDVVNCWISRSLVGVIRFYSTVWKREFINIANAQVER
jgi:hypothetical protein